MSIRFQLENNLSVDEFKDVLVQSGLGERRPVDDKERLQDMLSNAQIVVVARENGHIIGVSRAITDYAYCCYLSDLAVIKSHQNKGIGTALIAETHTHAGEKTTLVLVSAPAAEAYYPKIGMKSYPCFGIPRSS